MVNMILSFLIFFWAKDKNLYVFVNVLVQYDIIISASKIINLLRLIIAYRFGILIVYPFLSISG